jgi:molecular chaperone Hsp33
MFLLAVDAAQAAGIMFQALPERESGSGRWQQLKYELSGLDIGRMCKIDDETLLSALFPEDDIRLFDPEPVAFHCDCSVERIEKMLCMLEGRELEQLVGEHDPVEVRCEFCNRLYDIPGATVLRLAAEMRRGDGSIVH